MRTKSINLRQVCSCNLLETPPIQRHKNTLRPLLIDNNSQDNPIIFLDRTRPRNKNRFTRTALPILRLPPHKLPSKPIRLRQAPKERSLDSLQPRTISSNGHFRPRTGPTIIRTGIHIPISRCHRVILADPRQFHVCSDNCLLHCCACDLVDVCGVDRWELVSDERAVYEWSCGIEDVTHAVLFVRDRTPLVTAEIDVDVCVSCGVDEVVRVYGVEEHEIGHLVCCDAISRYRVSEGQTTGSRV